MDGAVDDGGLDNHAPKLHLPAVVDVVRPLESQVNVLQHTQKNSTVTTKVVGEYLFRLHSF